MKNQTARVGRQCVAKHHSIIICRRSFLPASVHDKRMLISIPRREEEAQLCVEQRIIQFGHHQSLVFYDAICLIMPANPGNASRKIEKPSSFSCDQVLFSNNTVNAEIPWKLSSLQRRISLLINSYHRLIKCENKRRAVVCKRKRKAKQHLPDLGDKLAMDVEVAGHESLVHLGTSKKSFLSATRPIGII